MTYYMNFFGRIEPKGNKSKFHRMRQPEAPGNERPIPVTFMELSPCSLSPLVRDTIHKWGFSSLATFYPKAWEPGTLTETAWT